MNAILYLASFIAVLVMVVMIIDIAYNRFEEWLNQPEETNVEFDADIE